MGSRETLVHNAAIYNSAGRRVWLGTRLYADNIHEFQDDLYYVLQQAEDQGEYVQPWILNARKIAVVRFGQYIQSDGQPRNGSISSDTYDYKI